MSEREQAQGHAARLESIADQISGVNVRRELRYAATFLRAIADRPEQPVAHVVADVDGSNKRVAFYSTVALRDVPVFTKLYAAPVARPEPAQPLVELDGGYHRGLADGFDEAKRQTAQEPAQPVAPVRMNDAELRAALITQLTAPPSHPAPSEAAPERQERIRE